MWQKILLIPLFSYTMFKRIVFLALIISFGLITRGQELQVRLTVMTNQISTQVDKKVFQTLQTNLTNFLNNRKWTNEVYLPAEKIQCNFLLNIEQEMGQNTYRASLTIQAARTAYNSNYQSPLVNYKDDNVVFRYVEFQPIEFNENRVQGNDPLVSNLTAILAYWSYIILGFDYDSFGIRGGDHFFQKAQNIANNAPESRDITGWRSFESQRNRYWLSENLNSSRFALIHDALYSYYRSGLDIFYENEDEGRNGIYNALNFLSTLDRENPNSMVIQFFFQGKSTELVKMFSRANPDLRKRALDILTRLDITNVQAYKDLK
jgi:hypothetical protein